VRRLAAIAALVALVAGCGGDERITVSAASSLKPALTTYGEDFEGARFSFAGSDQLAAQIRAGARPDVFVAASAVLMQDLFEERLVEEPVTVAYNRLVVAVEEDSDIRSLEQLGDDGVKVAIGTRSVPIGSYARAGLRQLPAGLRARIEDNIASEEPDASALVGRVHSGAVDAAIVYRTDVLAVPELRAVDMAVPVRPAYAAAVVRGRDDHGFVDGLREALRRAGFEVPP
jgi:molybdate transport system substrate-binding protein